MPSQLNIFEGAPGTSKAAPIRSIAGAIAGDPEQESIGTSDGTGAGAIASDPQSTVDGYGGMACGNHAMPNQSSTEYSPLMEPSFTWGSLAGVDFLHAIEAAYAEVTGWRRNLFRVPSGKHGKAFVSELSRLFRSFAEATALESVALKAAMVMPHLLLQKTSRTSRAKDHCEILGRRLEAWRLGDIDGLMRECHVFQRHMETSRNAQLSEGQLASRFSRLMLAGKTGAALRLLADEGRGSVLPAHQRITPDDPSAGTVLDTLKDKHPPAGDVDAEALISDSERGPDWHPDLFNQITGDCIRRAVLKLKSGGSAGPSGLDALAWQRICTSFKGSSTELCKSLAQLARRICTEHVDFKGLSAFTNCRLIALDKCPGVRPIGVGEVSRRIIGKAILSVVRADVCQVAGSVQLCAGQEGGCEAAVHATRLLFSDDACEGALLVDASNAFNSLNRKVALKNIAVLCPSLSTVLTNTYRGNSHLFVDGETILSCEGTTQGDPLAMVFYAIATIPLIRACKVEGLHGEAWFADDANGTGPLSALRTWWDKLVELGPRYGYHPNGCKTWLIVKPELYDAAIAAFRGTDVAISIQGKRHLGAALGSRSFVEMFVTRRIDEWIAELKKLTRIAACHPQAAYSAFIHGVRGRWLYLTRTVPGIKDLFQPLEDALQKEFIPALTGRSAPADLERELLSLPAKFGGLGIINPVTSAESEHSASLRLTSDLVCLLVQQSTEPTSPLLKSYPSQQSRQAIRKIKDQRWKEQAAALREKLSTGLNRAMDLAVEKGASSWLSVIPLRDHGFDLSKSSFRDALCLRYGWELPNTPSLCVCGHAFTTDHALSCPTGGLPTLRHNEIRDLLATRLSEVCVDVATEPTLQSLTGEEFSRLTANREDDARLDIRARGFWGSRLDCAFFDVRVFNPFAQSNRNTSLTSVYRRHERQKQRQYEERVRNIEHASFTPLVFSTSGGASRLTTTFLQHLASQLTAKEDAATYSMVMACLRTQLSFCLLRSSVLCLRGCRSSAGRPRTDIAKTAADLVFHQSHC